MKESTSWYSPRIEREIRLVRWGHFGVPVLIFPTAGGDAEECERFHLISSITPLIEAGRVKAYSVDSVAGRAWLEKTHSPEYCSLLQNRFDSCVYDEVVPAIRADCRGSGIEIVVAGASIGAFNAVATACRHPDAFRMAIGMSGTYDLENWLQGRMNLDFYFSSPMHFLPGLNDGGHIETLRRRLILLPFGGGRWEDPSQSWRMAEVLGSRGVPNRVDQWGPEYDHDWPSWRAMLPRYLDEHF